MGHMALLAGLGITWVAGVAVVAALYRVRLPADGLPHSWIAGCGWFVGITATTAWMRGLSAAGVPFGAFAIALPLGALAVVAGWVATRREGPRVRDVLRDAMRALAGDGLTGWQRVAWQAIVAWLVFRFALLLAEVWWRPLYPWDAWTQWSTKARVWFEMRMMVPFAGATEWLAAPADGLLWFDAAPHYPATMPLMQTYSALLLGRWDDTVVNLPWWCTGVALALGIHGALRRLHSPALPALAAAALLMCLPIVDVHVALAGYADLPLAAYLVLGTIAALAAIRDRNIGDACLALLLLGTMALVKNPGKVWIVVLLPAFIVAALPRRGLGIAAVLFAGAIFALLVGARNGITLLGYKFDLRPAMPWGALFDAYFSFANWHMLWYAAAATAAFGWRHLFSREVAPLTVAVAGGLMFLFIGFAFSNVAQWVEDQSTVNRATLHIAPLVVVWMFVCLRALLRERVAPAAPAPS